MPHFGHAAGLSDTTSGCFGHAWAADAGAGAIATGRDVGAVAHAASGAATKNTSIDQRVFMPT